MRFLVVGLFALAGCAGSQGEANKSPQLSAAEEREVKARLDNVRQQIQLRKEMLEIFKMVKDRPSMERGLEELRKVHEKAAVVEGDLRKLGAPSANVKERVESDPLFEELHRLHVAAAQEGGRIGRIEPGGKEFLDAWSALSKPRAP